MIACKNSQVAINNCFTDISKPIISGKGKEEFMETDELIVNLFRISQTEQKLKKDTIQTYYSYSYGSKKQVTEEIGWNY